jgi:transposase-like protein
MTAKKIELNKPPATVPTRVRARDRVDPRDLIAYGVLDAADAAAPVIDAYAEGITFRALARRYGVSTRLLHAWLRADPVRDRSFHAARDARALALVDEAHDRTTALADALPDDVAAVTARVKLLQWDAGRSSRLYADRQVTETAATLDVTVYLADDEMRDRLASLIGAIPPGQVIEGEIIP